MARADQWIDRLTQAGMSDLLDMDVSYLADDYVELSAADDNALRKASAKRSRGLTLRRALQARNLPVKARAAAFQVCEVILSVRAPPAEAEPKRPRTLKDIVAWLDDAGASILLHAPPRTLTFDAPTPYVKSWFGYQAYYCATVLAALNEVEAAFAEHDVLMATVVDALADRLSWPRTAAQAYRNVIAKHSKQTAENNVDRWTHTALRSLKERVDAGDTVGFFNFDPSIHEDDLLAYAGGYSASLEASWDGAVKRTGGGHRPISERYERALTADWLATVIEAVHEESPAGRRVREAMNRPLWSRVLNRVDHAIASVSPTTESDRVVVFRVKVGSDGVPRIRFGSAKSSTSGRFRARDERDLMDLSRFADAAERQMIARLYPLDWTLRTQFAIADALVGHPRVLPDENRSVQPIPVRRASLSLHIDHADDRVHATWRVNGKPYPSRKLVRAAQAAESHERGLLLLDDAGLWVVPCSQEARTLLIAVGDSLSDVEAEAAGALLSRLQTLNTLVDVSIGDALRGERIPSDDRLVVRARFDGGLWLSLRVQPLVESTSYLPGEGPPTLHAMRDGKPVYVERDPAEEVDRANALARELSLGAEDEPFAWAVDDLDHALTAVHTLSESPHRLQVDGSLPRTSRINASALTVRVKKDRGWFSVGGQASTPLGDLDLSTLLDAIQDDADWVSTGKGYVRLDQTLRAALTSLNATRSGGKPSLSPVHVPLMDALKEAGALIDGVKPWLEATERVQQAATLSPTVPQALNGTLRHYQEEGFQWLARLAHWAPGAVLADDMGLGKTIQSIALLLRRADDGPALVVAPTSVGFNWLAELKRFAPSLNVVSYRGTQRGALLDGAAPGTVFVTSYGILVRDAERLQATSFATAVFDEAQALKNPASQRARTARDLDVGFRLGLSGTPVENHVDDLWSVFACTVRGLLGSHAAFRDQWAKPIDAGDNTKRQALARVVSPFLLRRTKRVVAPELPERTEVVHRVTLSGEHRALYERSRVLALARIENADPKQARFKVLSELTRLRQMACDPRLSDPTSPIVGSKVRHLVRRLEDVRETGDKALVFSTFVSHLKLAREALEERGFRVQWLTGATTPDARQAAVEAFQDGQSDVFLLSTKAGGTGLNLTAASYVFHMDPWWNPASEDQATDRAHRIGQDKPVTVYRLIAAETVEERILDMQEEKRELVDALLSDSDKSAPLSMSDLRNLIAGETVSDDEPPGSDAPEPQTSSQAEESDVNWLASAVRAMSDADLKPASRAVYISALKALDRQTPSTDPLPERYAAFMADASVSRSRKGSVRAALRRAGLSTE